MLNAMHNSGGIQKEEYMQKFRSESGDLNRIRMRLEKMDI